MIELFQLPTVRPLKAAGTVMPGAKLYFYATGTSTPQNTYTDFALTTASANPVVADSAGRFPPIYLDPSLPNYRVTLTDSADVTQTGYPVDDYPSHSADDTLTAAEVSAGLDSADINTAFEPYNIYRYKAVGDGAADDSTPRDNWALAASIANALARAPGGTFRFTTEWVYPPAGLKVQGDGINQTVFKFDGTAGLDLIRNANQQSSSPLITHSATFVSFNSGTNLATFTIASDVTTTALPGRRCYLSGTTTTTLFGVIETATFGAGVTTIAATMFSGTVASESLTFSTGELPASFTDQYVHLSDMTLDGNAKAVRCLWLDGVEDIRLENVLCKDNQAAAGHLVRVRYFRRFYADRCRFEGGGANGLGVAIGEDAQITACQASGNTAMGMTLQCVRRGYMQGITYNNGANGATLENYGAGIGDAIANCFGGDITVDLHSFKNGNAGLAISTAVQRAQIRGAYNWNNDVGCSASTFVGAGVSSEIDFDVIADWNGTHGLSIGDTSFASQITVSGHFNNNNRLNAGGSGINVNNSVDAASLTIMKFQCNDTRAAPLQQYGIELENALRTKVVIIGGQCIGNATAPTLITGDADSLYIKGLVTTTTSNNSKAHNLSGSGTINVTDGTETVRFTGSGGALTAIMGSYVGQEVTVIAKVASCSITHSATLRMPGQQNYAMATNSSVTFRMVTDGEWVAQAPPNHAALTTYTITNGTADRTYNANASSAAELADILYTLIGDLELMGLPIHRA